MSDWLARAIWLAIAVSGISMVTVPVQQGAGRRVAEAAS
jgi:hypothetical protein